MDKQTKELIIWGGGSILAIVFANKILTILGIRQAPEQTEGTKNPLWNADSQEKWKYSYHQDVYDSIVYDIYDAFKYLGVNAFSYTLAAIKKAKTRGDVHAIVKTFQWKYKNDLYEFLKNGGGGIFSWQGLSNIELAQINNYVNSLPQ